MPARIKVMKVNSLIDVSENVFFLNTLLDSHLFSQSRPRLFLRWRRLWSSHAFQTTKMSSPPTAPRDRSGTSFSRVNRTERLKVRVSRRENERVSCCLQCSTAGYWHSHIKRNKHFSPNLGYKRRKQKRERESREEDTESQPDKGSDNQTGGQIRQGEWDSDQNTGKTTNANLADWNWINTTQNHSRLQSSPWTLSCSSDFRSKTQAIKGSLFKCTVGIWESIFLGCWKM